MTSTIPDWRLPQMKMDAGVLHQYLLEMSEDGATAVRQTTNVIQVGEEVFVGQQEFLKREQSAMLSEGAQHGHEGIALLATFSLMDHVGVAAVVVPEILGWLREKLEHERKHSVASTDLLKSVQHRSSRDHVKRTESVNGQHGGATVKICERLDGVCHAFPCLGGQRVLKRRSRPPLQTRSVPHDQPPNKIPTHDAQDAPARLLKSSKTSHAQQSEDVRRDLRSGEILSGTVEKCSVRHRFQDQT